MLAQDAQVNLTCSGKVLRKIMTWQRCSEVHWQRHPSNSPTNSQHGLHDLLLTFLMQDAQAIGFLAEVIRLVSRNNALIAQMFSPNHWRSEGKQPSLSNEINCGLSESFSKYCRNINREQKQAIAVIVEVTVKIIVTNTKIGDHIR